MSEPALTLVAAIAAALVTATAIATSTLRRLAVTTGALRHLTVATCTLRHLAVAASALRHLSIRRHAGCTITCRGLLVVCARAWALVVVRTNSSLIALRMQLTLR